MGVAIPQSELDALEKAFQLMWGNFPEAVQLTYKNREVIALNKASLKLGRSKGTKCSTRGKPEDHQGCLANQVMSTQQSMFKKLNFYGREIITYWLPVDGYPDLFIHFAITTAIDNDKPQESN
ncbi:MAG: hypothetical protein LBL76_08435 [Treponema sp.]|jgi:hypothetical protein|nr:hypothetical protein [Treponema sp.]